MVRFVYVISYYADKFEEAIEHLTEAISLNPTSAIMYATRGTFFYVMFPAGLMEKLYA